jgi:hypothetical protein
MIPKAKDFVKLQIDPFVDAQLKKAQDSLIPSLKDEFEKAFAEAEASSESVAGEGSRESFRHRLLEPRSRTNSTRCAETR